MIKYKRILLKLTGELFGSDGGKALNFEEITKIAQKIADIKTKYNLEIAIVTGAGNIFRGRNRVEGSDRVANDQICMIATSVNALALGTELDRIGVASRVMTAFDIEGITERYVQKKAISYLEEGKVVVLGGGTGNPYFTTDSAAALRASELKCEIILKGSNVDGVYDTDPNKNPKANKFETLRFSDVIEKKLQIMDLTAFTICSENNMPIIVFNTNDLANIDKILSGEKVGTLISNNS